MFSANNKLIVLLAVHLLYRYVQCKSTDTKELLEKYEQNLNSSISLNKSDKELLALWTQEFQVKYVNVSTKYRVQMLRHKLHSFRRLGSNLKWSQCIDLHIKQILKTEQVYYKNESECLKTASTAGDEKRNTVNQLEKQIRKWRKGYRYLINLCKMNNLGDDESAGECLVEYMQRDNYDQALVRLMLLKLEAMGELFEDLVTSLNTLEDCLKSTLSAYLDNVRSVMETLNICYERLNKI